MDREQFQQKHGIIGSSAEIREIVDVIQQVAPTDITVLLSGESGVGKEVFAHALHDASKRSQKNMVIVNCGAIPEGLIESELFGHEKGSFTSATETRRGYFEIADGGTVFLDEIGEMPLSTQVKLLRVLENGEYMRVGSSAKRTADVRIIAATNKNLEYEVQQKRFRADLFFRLRSVNIIIPPLRKRREDIPLLAEHFTNEIAKRNSIAFAGFTNEAADMLMNYDWHGNVRELKNVVESVVILEGENIVTKEILLKHLKYSPGSDAERNLPIVTNKTVEQAERELIYRALLDLKSNIIELQKLVANKTVELPKSGGVNIVENPMTLEEMESQLIKRALDRHHGNRRLAARELKISERTLYRKIKELGLAE